MGYKQKRKVVKFGAFSKGVVLPKGWTEFHQLDCGDALTILGDSVLVITVTEEQEEKARRILKLIEQEL